MIAAQPYAMRRQPIRLAGAARGQDSPDRSKEKAGKDMGDSEDQTHYRPLGLASCEWGRPWSSSPLPTENVPRPVETIKPAATCIRLPVAALHRFLLPRRPA